MFSKRVNFSNREFRVCRRAEEREMMMLAARGVRWNEKIMDRLRAAVKNTLLLPLKNFVISFSLREIKLIFITLRCVIKKIASELPCAHVRERF